MTQQPETSYEVVAKATRTYDVPAPRPRNAVALASAVEEVALTCAMTLRVTEGESKASARGDGPYGGDELLGRLESGPDPRLGVASRYVESWTSL